MLTWPPAAADHRKGSARSAHQRTPCHSHSLPSAVLSDFSSAPRVLMAAVSTPFDTVHRRASCGLFGEALLPATLEQIHVVARTRLVFLDGRLVDVNPDSRAMWHFEEAVDDARYAVE